MGTQAAFEKLAEGFYRRGQKHTPDLHWWGQVGALDGMDILMKAPSEADVDNPDAYRVSRKAGYCLLLMAIADANYRIIWHDMSAASTSHDSSAWA